MIMAGFMIEEYAMVGAADQRRDSVITAALCTRPSSGFMHQYYDMRFIAAA
jgi:hypothetical protein